MIDPAVERQYSDTRELLGLWKTFHEFFSMGVKGENITTEKENQFLELKSRIAMLHDSFMEALTTNQNIGQEVLNVISRAITLKHLGKQSQADVKKMEIEWHESYLLLNETIGSLEEKRRELSTINETQFKASKAAGVAKQKAGNFFGHFYFKLSAIIIALLVGTIGVQALGIYDYDNLGKIGALREPFRWGKAVVHKVYSPDSPWPTIETGYRKSYSGWPAGIKPPVTELGAERSAIVSKLRIPEIQQLLGEAADYKKETAERQNESPIEIHSFRFATADPAKKVETAWDEANRNTRDAYRQHFAIVRDVNIIVVIHASRELSIADVRMHVYGAK